MSALQQYRLDPCREALGNAVHQALSTMLPEGAALGMSARDVGFLLEQPRESKMGDYALPCFRFAKDTKQKPQDVASAVAAKVGTADGWILKAEAVGAFLNFFVDKTKMAEIVVPAAISGSLYHEFEKTPHPGMQRVMIEFSQPNTHKEFHVGHSRNVTLGNALVRLFRYCGYEVTAANYFGDEGTHIAKCLWYMQKNALTPPAEHRGEWLGQVYADSTRALAAASEDERKTYDAEISRILRDIEQQDGKNYELWKTTRQWSLDGFQEIYDWLDVKFDVLFYESEVSREAQEIVEKYLAKGVFVVDDGAVGVDLKPYKLGFSILRKRDGNTLYATKDLALARVKFEDYKIDRSIYVVADEQNHHFKQVFKILELMGFEKAKNCYHLSYGMVMLPEGKMSSRDGTSVTFNSLRRMIDAELAEILKKYESDWSPAEIRDVAHKLNDGAIKYGMISTDPKGEIVFNMQDWLSFEGNSGPYLMYSYARTRSILRKAAEQGALPDASKLEALTEASEHEMVRHLYDFNDVVASACENYKPSILATHLFYMCKSFNRFYADVSVLKANTEAQRGARLALIAAFAATLQQGLALLAIKPPERM